jgi:uncharacterized protein YggE
MKTTVALLLSLALSTAAAAQNIAPPPRDVTSVTLTASATMQVDNDRMTIILQAEAEKPSATAAAAEVNAKMAKGLASAKAVSVVEAKTTSYSTNQVFEKGRFVRWRVSQLLEVETADFAAGANLATKLQHEALVEWQSLAKQAAASMGFGGYTPGRLTVNAGDSGPRPRFAAQAMAKAADAVTVAAGTSEMTTTVTGEAILDRDRKPN